MCLINSFCFHCFHSWNHASTILPMQSTTLSYAINYFVLKIFKSKLKFMQKHPFIDHHRHHHQHRQPQVWGQQPHHLVRQDHPAPDQRCTSPTVCSWDVDTRGTATLLACWELGIPNLQLLLQASASGEMSPPCWQRYPPSRDKLSMYSSSRLRKWILESSSVDQPLDVMRLGLTMHFSFAFTSPSSVQPSTTGILSSKISARLRIKSGAKMDMLEMLQRTRSQT